MLRQGAPVQVKKLRPDRTVHFGWEGIVLRCDDSGVVLRAEFNVDLVEREWGSLRRGDVFHEFYYWDRSYNVFEVLNPDGTLKGWYSNLGLPAEVNPDTGGLEYVDLALDVWANPDGSFVVLDEDELEEILASHPELVDAAHRGRTDLIALAQSRSLPRWPG